MTKQSLFWASNIKYLRNRKQLSPEDFALHLGISHARLLAHENGKRIKPTLNDLLDFSQYFKISIDTLLKTDLSILSEEKLLELEAGNDVYITGSKIQVLDIHGEHVDKQA